MITRKKAQISMEFLTTYGWALLVLAIMMGGLTYVLMTPDQIIPPSCTFPDKLQCLEHAITTNSVQTNMMNFDDRTINITKVTCVIEDREYTNDLSVEIPVGQSGLVNCTDSGIASAELAERELVRAKMIITYKKQGNEYPSITQGNIIGTVIQN